MEMYLNISLINLTICLCFFAFPSHNTRDNRSFLMWTNWKPQIFCRQAFQKTLTNDCWWIWLKASGSSYLQISNRRDSRVSVENDLRSVKRLTRLTKPFQTYNPHLSGSLLKQRFSALERRSLTCAINPSVLSFKEFTVSLLPTSSNNIQLQWPCEEQALCSVSPRTKLLQGHLTAWMVNNKISWIYCVVVRGRATLWTMRYTAGIKVSL